MLWNRIITSETKCNWNAILYKLSLSALFTALKLEAYYDTALYILLSVHLCVTYIRP